MKKIRVRFAPSPTGALHLGGVRTALYNYLFAKQNSGDFILRIEDTDTERYVVGAEDYIMESLEWIGITPDESPSNGGPFAPYRQSERRHIYDGYIEQLLSTEHAYLAFDTKEELEEIRKKYEKEGKTFSYNHETRQSLRNSLSLTKEEIKKLLDENTPYVIRFKIPNDEIINLNDIVRGEFSVNTNTLDDKVLVKNDGMPTYHFANVVDDHEMNISHVIRGEEWLPSMPLHILLYKAMGWNHPEFAHLSLILKPSGNGKLSKRDGDKLGFPVIPLNFTDPITGKISTGYREEGYFPESFTNMLALLGWSPMGDKEILNLEEMIKEFDLHKVHKAGARFSIDKAKWFNQQYLQKTSDVDILPKFKDILSEKKVNIPTEKALKIISLMKERAVFIKDIFNEGEFFFYTPNSYDEKALKKSWTTETSEFISEFCDKLSIIDFKAKNIKELIQEFAKEKSLGLGKIMMPLRLSLVGELKGPDIPEIMEIIGKDECINRIEKLVNYTTTND